MKFSKIKYFILLCLFASSFGIAQNALKMFEWKDHLSYNRAYSIADYDNKIYCAVTIPDPGNNPFYKQTSQGIYYFDKTSSSFGHLSKVDGLSDTDPVILKTNTYNNTLFIGYENSNIDILKNGTVINISDLKRKQIMGSKKINAVVFKNNLAYVSTALGIVVIDTDLGEVKDSYIIGSGGTYLNVYDCALSNTKVFAATSTGVYSANLNSPNLSNFQEWVLESSLPAGPYNCIINFKGTIITNFSKYIQSNQATLTQDTLYTYNGTSWAKYTYKAHNQYSYTIQKIITDDAKNRIAFLDPYNIEVRDDAGNFYSKIWSYASTTYLAEQDLLFDNDLNYYWVADRNLGLLKCKVNSVSTTPLEYVKYKPNSPNTFMANDIKVVNNKLIIAPTYLTDYPGSFYLQEGIYIYENEEWRHDKKVLGGPYFDINSVAVDPKDENHFFAGSYGGGVFEYLNDSMIAVFNCTNSSLPLAQGSSGSDTRVTCVETDKDGNLWVAAAHTNKIINVRDVNGTWHSLSFANSFVKSDQLIIDKTNQVWVTTLDPSIVVYKNDGTFAQPSTANTFTINTADAEGQINAAIIYCLQEDNEGDIWIGTNKGIYVIYDPENVAEKGGVNAQQIFIEEEGATKILFETEDVKCIAIDGANNKWVGTNKNGVYCISPDGQKELFHFTKENSPLFSNFIIEITLNQKTGEVFITTDKGLISFQNTIIEGNEKFEDVYAYPNPIKPGYTGPIMIKGLIDKSSMKITDIAGNMVYEATVEGGQAVWYGKNFKGERVASGVYLVMCATPDGQQKKVTKILVLN